MLGILNKTTNMNRVLSPPSHSSICNTIFPFSPQCCPMAAPHALLALSCPHPSLRPWQLPSAFPPPPVISTALFHKIWPERFHFSLSLWSHKHGWDFLLIYRKHSVNPKCFKEIPAAEPALQPGGPFKAEPFYLRGRKNGVAPPPTLTPATSV